MSVSQQLIDTHRALFEKATHHKLTQELCAGTLPDRKLYIYLAQDLQFFQSGMRLLTKTTSLAPDNDSLLTLARKIGFFANDENDYFYECLEKTSGSLDKSDQVRFKTTQLPQVDKYIAYLEKCAKDEDSYAKLITFVYCMELVYLEWPRYFPIASNLHWKYQKWIDLHAGEHFETWCDFLRAEVDKCSFKEVSETFENVLKLEYEFFEACYQH
ncbi:LADA_0H17678g1_1 [Lachancea dasiensis]|uniref:LADA_0H17678g1_1 n=1 Tax=Lachancea dasiensis TaxID=1072105 RepID=A0A1G4K5N0_9SACH|nr:LADA_0H17678g1_1 [Lachancea dasiensis]